MDERYISIVDGGCGFITVKSQPSPPPAFNQAARLGNWHQESGSHQKRAEQPQRQSADLGVNNISIFAGTRFTNDSQFTCLVSSLKALASNLASLASNLASLA